MITKTLGINIIKKWHGFLSIINNSTEIMAPDLQYDTAANAIEELRVNGYTVDFNLRSNSTAPIEEFEIKAIYRYEGETDPADEVIIYAIESKNGLKGTFITGYGSSFEDPFSLLNRLKNTKQ